MKTIKDMGTTNAINVVNGVVCSMAILNKETEKAINISYTADIYGEQFVIKNQWFPKSMIYIEMIDNGTIWFNAKNEWILDKKTKEYCQWVADSFPNVKSEIKTYLSRMNRLVINQVSR